MNTTITQKALEFLRVTVTVKRAETGRIESIEIQHSLNGWLILLLAATLLKAYGVNVAAVGAWVTEFTRHLTSSGAMKVIDMVVQRVYNL